MLRNHDPPALDEIGHALLTATSYDVGNPPVLIWIACMVILYSWGHYIEWLRAGLAIIKKTDHLYSWFVRTLRRFRWFIVGALGLALPIFATLEAFGALKDWGVM